MPNKNQANPAESLRSAFDDALEAVGNKAIDVAEDKLAALTTKLVDLAEGNGAGALGKAAKNVAGGDGPVTGLLKGGVGTVKDKLTPGGDDSGGGDGGGGKPATKATNFEDSIDVGVPVSVAYNQWTQYDQWPDFMKKVEHAKQDKDEPTVNLKAQVFLSHRSWRATIIDQIPDERIIWRSTGDKGHIDGCVTFHELGPRLTRILVTLEYYPQGLFERVGNIWRAPGRRARLELKNFRRHVMMNTILDPDAAEGWRGEIEDSEVVETHDEAMQRERENDAHDDAPEEDEHDDDAPDEDDEHDDGAPDEDDEHEHEHEDEDDEHDTNDDAEIEDGKEES